MIPTDPQEAYDVGHTEGESCRDADWTIALDDVWSDGVDCTPEAVALELVRLQRTVAEVKARVEGVEWREVGSAEGVVSDVARIVGAVV